ncbi:hypothetical protein [Flocculibacter collagenilyticus]|uniref:hypothetical protein n=1 Tax=Flocculibacter collagenilyticus TaxID=2744479 RepID=UPI0018F6248E|nr:hypothetical protein [Flocculibacter collagenilyticus]
MAIAHSRESFYRLVQRFPKRKQILMEGDSWIGHPLPHVSNLTVQLNRYLNGRCNILSLGEVSHLAAEMMSGSQLRFLQSVLKGQQFDFSLLIFSAGGNDILDNTNDAFSLYKLIVKAEGNEPRNYINNALWQEMLASVKEAYLTLLATRDKIRPELPIIAHTYEYIYPRNKGAEVFFNTVRGPWVLPVMLCKHITSQQLQRDIISVLLQDFKQMLLDVSVTHKLFYVVDTHNTLLVHQQWGIEVPEWDDEIHPNKDGFKRLVTERLGPAVKVALAARS